MSRVAWQATITNESGDAIPRAQVEVRDQSSGALVTLHAAETGTVTLTNPFNADDTGFAKFFVPAGTYRVIATADGSVREWSHQQLGNLAAQSRDNVTLDKLTVPTIEAVQYLRGAFGDLMQSTDEWLRINPGDGHTEGVFTGSAKLRTDGALQVGGNGATLNVDGAGLNYRGPHQLLHSNSADLTDAAALNSPRLFLRGYYDSNATAGAITATQRQFSIQTVIAAGGGYSLDFINDAGSTVASLSATGGIAFDGALSVEGQIVAPQLTLTQAGNANIELGRTDGTASSPFVDFHSGATAVDYDARITASGGNGAAGGGTLTYEAALHALVGAVEIGNELTVKNGGGAVASIGAVRLNNANALAWRNAANTGDSYVWFDSSDVFEVRPNGNSVLTVSAAGALTVKGPGRFDSDLALWGDAVTVDGGAAPSPRLAFRGHYDSDGTVGVTSTKREMFVQLAVNADGTYRTVFKNDTGSEVASIDSAGKFTGDGSGLTGVIIETAVLKAGDTMTGSLTLAAPAVTVDGGANDSPTLILRSTYDSDSTTGVVSTNSDWVLLASNSGGDGKEVTIRLDGVGKISVSQNGNIYAGAYGWLHDYFVKKGDGVTINTVSPTIYFQDTDHRSAMIHVNSNNFYVLRGSGINSTTWAAYNGRWPLQINLENNHATFGEGGNFNNKVVVSRNIGTGGSYSNSQLELHAGDGGDISLGFHRGGYSACALLHEGTGLKLVSNDTATVTTFAAGDIYSHGGLVGRSNMGLGEVGTYAYLIYPGGGTLTPNATYAGSVLRYSGVSYGAQGSTQSDNAVAAGHHGTPPGTWRAMGGATVGSSQTPGTLCLRIS